ncbi:MAG: T9SS type A sorting domain-containing protein [Bacteroidetes bacterium]|nr:T9SS type A sorting domain-containing protein [Bacteroidota bacterium]
MKSIFIITTLFLATILHSQTTLSVGEIYDFSINDEFHSSDIFPGATPNAIRMKVIDKHFSANNDTVYYTRSFNNYQSVYSPFPEPHIDYFFDNYIDTVFYTNLSDSVVCHVLDTTCTSIFETTICDIPANGWAEGGYLQGQFHSKIFGKALGQVTDNYWEEDSDNSYDTEMFYFKKDTMECGIPDSTTTSISSNNLSFGLVNIYPKPFTEKFNIQFADDKHSYKIKIFDIKGVEIFETIVNDCNNVVIDKMKNKGFYLIKIETEGKSYISKILKK